MTLDTKEITTPIFVIVILILAAAIAYAGYNYGHVNSNVVTSTVATVASTPVPTPTPDTSYLTNVVTVDSMTTSGGFPQVNIREDNRAFNVLYSDYDNLNVGDRVQFHVVSTYSPYGGIIYKTDYVVIVSHSWDNTRYYYYDNKYYRDDNHVTVEVTRDEASRHNFVNGKPAHW